MVIFINKYSKEIVIKTIQYLIRSNKALNKDSQKNFKLNCVLN